MKGIETAFIGMLARDAEVKSGRSSGRQFISVPVIVGENPDEQWVSVASFSASDVDLAPQLTKGNQVYVEGKLKLRSWMVNGDSPRYGLSVVASLIQPLGQIGNQRPKKSRSTPKAKADSQAPLQFADGTSAAQGDDLPI